MDIEGGRLAPESCPNTMQGLLVRGLVEHGGRERGRRDTGAEREGGMGFESWLAAIWCRERNASEPTNGEEADHPLITSVDGKDAMLTDGREGLYEISDQAMVTVRLRWTWIKVPIAQHQSSQNIHQSFNMAWWLSIGQRQRVICSVPSAIL